MALENGAAVPDAERLSVVPDMGRWFDGPWYLTRNRDVAYAGLDPLAHYQRYGEAEGRRPSPWFDPLWYRAAYDVPMDQSPLAHFLARRGNHYYLPSTGLYLVPLTPPWRDDPAPFDRYLDAMTVPERELLPELGPLRASGLIDTAAYHGINKADPFLAGTDPVLQYCRFGWRLGWRPSTAFDPAWYAATNPDVARRRINPLMHYLLEGEPANRRPVPWFDPAWYRAEHAIPPDQSALAHYLAHRPGRAVSPHPLFDVAWYVERYGETIPADIDPFSHYLVWGAIGDIAPSPRFDARAWRHRHMPPSGAPFRHLTPVAARNPLVEQARRDYERDDYDGGDAYDGCRFHGDA